MLKSAINSKLCQPIKYIKDPYQLSVLSLNCTSNRKIHHNRSTISEELNSNGRWKTFFGLAIGGTAAYYIYSKRYTRNAYMREYPSAMSKTKKSSANDYVDGMPMYGYEEVAKHSTEKTRIWVTFKSGVYDITDFIAKHPGGTQILEAAGSGVDAFWDLYQQHNTPEVLELFETYRIGNYKDVAQPNDITDIWDNQPKRDPRLIVRSERPYNAETPQELLGESFITPNHLFYVRHHLPVPDIDMKKYRLIVSSKYGKTLKLTLEDIKKFPKHTITAALMCAGNRRSGMNTHKPTKGLAWGPGAIGNAVWTGARLKDVLEAAGITSDEEKHVQFIGMDLDATGKPYGASIPLSRAMDERSDVILAYEMNGHPISRDQGFPIRAFVPGTVGARCVKWLNGITISEEESLSHWQRFDYKGFNPSVDPTADDYNKSTSIQYLPVISAFLTPSNGNTVTSSNGFIEVKGYAWSGAGQKIIRVDLTADNGKTWIDGKIIQQDTKPAGRHWGWTLWSAKIPIQNNQKEIELCVKAVDSNHNTQPESVENVWNARGVLNNSMDRIKLKIA